ncbi:MAG: ATP-binding protein [Bacteroidota bacterium]
MDMASLIPRWTSSEIQSALNRSPSVALLGPRQCGKSTLAQKVMEEYESALYLDLERPSDLRKLDDPEWFLSTQHDRLICLDEIQRKPELFPILRSIIDKHDRPGMYLILGSASRELIKQSSESLAGRISFKRLTPFLWSEINNEGTIERYLNRGGFPRSYLASSDEDSVEWRLDFIDTFLERDLRFFGGFTPVTMRKLWQMLAHTNGQTANYSKLGDSLGISHTTVRKYINLLESTYMLEQVPPYGGNTKKRLIKSPKVYISDTGLTAALLNLKNFEELTGHPVFGSLWETTVLINVIGHFPRLSYSFYRSSNGNEVDFVLEDGSRTIALECKASLSPTLAKGTYSALDDIDPDETFVVSPIEEGFPMKPGIDVVSLRELITHLEKQFT